MKKIVPIIIIILLLCGCTAQSETATQVPTDSGQAQLSESSGACEKFSVKPTVIK